MKDEKATVAVVMCTYNGERFIREQMDSILAQTYPISEIIVQDDGSNDQTVDIVRSYAALHPNIHLYENEHNLGFNENFRQAALRATSQFIAIADQDDVWRPNKIERLVESIGSHDLCYSDITRGKRQDRAEVVSYKPYCESVLFRALLGHTMLLRTDFAHDAEAWHRSWFYDWSLALSAHLYGRGVAKVSEPLVWHRLHGDEVSSHMGKVKGRTRAWHPYLKGWKAYREMQASDRWRSLYSPLLQAKNIEQYPLVGKMLRCMLSSSRLDLLRLCLLCMKHRATIYPGRTHGLAGYLRGFAFPAIYAYFNKFLFLQ